MSTESKSASKPDLREITITQETTLIVDVARFFVEYDAEWQEAKADDCTPEEFIEETIGELAIEDLEDFAVNHPTKGYSSETLWTDTDIRKFK